jgi:hypothetical protein
LDMVLNAPREQDVIHLRPEWARGLWNLPSYLIISK